MKKSAFTLAEVLITTVILWILSVILFRSYNTISDSLFRISNENLIVREWIFLLEVLENKVANAKIDFEWYDVKPVNNSWFTDRLILKRWDDKIEFLFSGNCNQKLSWTAEINLSSSERSRSSKILRKYFSRIWSFSFLIFLLLYFV
jgi:type II secretory pathway pseudopilin PulG